METILYQAPFLAPGRRTVGWAGVPSSFLGLKNVGNGLILLAIFGFIFSLGPVLSSEVNYRFKKANKPPVFGFGNMLNSPGSGQDIFQTSPDVNFSLIIPKIEAKAKVIPNVNAGNSKEYNQALKTGIAHAAGTVFPGMKGTILLFAHSTDAPWNIGRYNAVFYLLRELKENDQIIVFFEGKKFYYSVSEIKIVEPTETAIFDQKEEELLILQTCWPPGTTKKALLVLAKP